MMPEASRELETMFATMAVVLAALFVAGVRVAWQRSGAGADATRRATLFALAGAASWLTFTHVVARSGALRFDSMPPTMLFMVAAIMAVAVSVALSPAGKRLAAGLPLAVLVGFQGFRLPLELMMHRAYTEGIMPVQMSYSGYNFDILTGIGALAVAAGLASGRLGLRAVQVWNALGVALLLGILVISFLSAPLPIRLFMNEPANVWVTGPPFIWLPAVMVLLAVMGHVVIARRLRMERRAELRGRPPQPAVHA